MTLGRDHFQELFPRSEAPQGSDGLRMGSPASGPPKFIYPLDYIEPLGWGVPVSEPSTLNRANLENVGYFQLNSFKWTRIQKHRGTSFRQHPAPFR